MIRNKKHLEFIRSLSCCVCGSIPCDAAHIRKGTGGGMGMKPGDDCVIPLCRSCHMGQHRTGEVSFWDGALEAAQELASMLYKNTGQVWKCAKEIAGFREVCY